LATLKETVKTDNIEDIKNKTQELSEAIQKVSAELYKANPQGAQQTPPNPSNEVNEKSEDEKNRQGG